MAGGGPPETFKIVRYSSTPGQNTLTTDTQHVIVSEADRVKIAAILGITDPAEQRRLLVGSVYIHPPQADPGS